MDGSLGCDVPVLGVCAGKGGVAGEKDSGGMLPGDAIGKPGAHAGVGVVSVGRAGEARIAIRHKPECRLAENCGNVNV